VRVVLDTNVFISGVFFGGLPHRILRVWRDGVIQLLLSSEILEEYTRVGEELAARFPGVDLFPVLKLVAMHAEFAEGEPLRKRVCDDPDDEKFLVCAAAGRVRVIVSGDKHLLAVSGWSGIDVLKPRAFVDAYLS
jgi:putative PIN family toxin of toxin-antitoxin system